MKQVKTARGRVIDMSALAKSNEEMRAVSPGNINMNARGDRIDSSGNVIQTVQAKSRAARNTTTAPEKRRLSDSPGAKQKKAQPKQNETDVPAEGLVEINRTEKTREDGSRYIEIEYDDGSMSTEEIK